MDDKPQVHVAIVDGVRDGSLVNGATYHVDEITEESVSLSTVDIRHRGLFTAWVRLSGAGVSK